jgi:hypothetical protein
MSEHKFPKREAFLKSIFNLKRRNKADGDVYSSSDSGDVNIGVRWQVATDGLGGDGW